jgi:hypothetical protein
MSSRFVKAAACAAVLACMGGCRKLTAQQVASQPAGGTVVQSVLAPAPR